MARVSVVIPTFNRASLLAEALAAVRSQTRPVDEIIIIDDGSTDDTRTVVSALDEEAIYLYQPNLGKCAALNNAIPRCSGDYIWICDDDDLAVPSALESLLTELERSGADYSFGSYRRFEVDAVTGQRTMLCSGFWPDLAGRSIFTALLEEFFMFHNGLLVRKAAYAAVGPFRTDLARSEDYEMALRLARGHKGVYVPKVVFLQRRHGGVRGTACEQFNPDRHAEKAIGYDKLIFRELYETLPLLEYGRELRALPAEAAKRGALLQRACVYARRKLWDISLEDLRRAARLEAAGTLTSQERRICRRFLLSKYGCDEVVTEPWIGDALRNLAAEGGLGRDMVRAVTQPLLWRAREALMQNRWRFCAAFLTLLISVHGYRGTAAMLFSSVKRRAFAAELGSFGTR